MFCPPYLIFEKRFPFGPISGFSVFHARRIRLIPAGACFSTEVSVHFVHKDAEQTKFL